MRKFTLEVYEDSEGVVHNSLKCDGFNQVEAVGILTIAAIDLATETSVNVQQEKDDDRTGTH